MYETYTERIKYVQLCILANYVGFIQCLLKTFPGILVDCLS